MKYAVVYESNSMNTEQVAYAIYDALDVSPAQKIIVNLGEEDELPDAEMYYIGFPVSNFNCGFRIMECFDKIQGKSVAVFATCGLMPTDKYKAKIESAIEVWIDEDTDYKGFYMCQGRTEAAQQQKMMMENPEAADAFERMFAEGEQHPDDDDLKAAADFVAGTK